MPEYKPSMFDKHGADAVDLLRTAPYAVVMWLFTTAELLYLVGFRWWVFPAGIIAGGFVGTLPITLGYAAGKTMHRFVADGSTTPYVEQYSYQQSLVMRGEVDAALESFEAVIAAEPSAVVPRGKAAELYVREKRNHTRAAELFREIQRIPTIATGEDFYATNRLVDLLIGPLGEPRRALVELRRLIDRYPDNPATANARQALAVLKSRVHDTPATDS